MKLQDLFIVAITFAAITNTAYCEIRKWADKSGTYSVQAEFIEVADGKAVLKREDGQTVRVPLDKLSPQDQEYVQKKITKSDDPFAVSEKSVATDTHIFGEGKKEQALKQGKAALDKNDFDLAISYCTEAIRLDPKYALAYGIRGLAQQGKGDRDKAIADFTEAIQIDPNNALAYGNRGLAYADKSELDKAIADFTETIRLDPKFAEAYGNRGLAYRRNGNTDKAIADYTKAVQLDPKDAVAYLYRGDAYAEKGELDKAIADYTNAIRLDPKFAEAYYYRGVAYEKKSDVDKASVDIAEAKRLGYSPSALFATADTLTLPSGHKFDTNAFQFYHAEWSQVFPSGSLSYADKYVGGMLYTIVAMDGIVLNGVAVQLYETGKPKFVANYKRGKLTDAVRMWVSNGDLLYFAQYRDGKKDGVVCLFRNGKPWLLQEYKDGELVAEGVVAGTPGTKEEANKELAATEEELKIAGQGLRVAASRWVASLTGKNRTGDNSEDDTKLRRQARAVKSKGIAANRRTREALLQLQNAEFQIRRFGENPHDRQRAENARREAAIAEKQAKAYFAEADRLEEEANSVVEARNAKQAKEQEKLFVSAVEEQEKLRVFAVESLNKLMPPTQK